MQIQLQCTLEADMFIKLYLDSRQNHSSIGMRQPGSDSLTNATEKAENYKVQSKYQYQYQFFIVRNCYIIFIISSVPIFIIFNFFLL